MLLSKTLGDPDYRYCIQASGICQQLPQVCVICPLQLIFYQHPLVSCSVLAEDIGAKGTNFLFLRLKFKFNADRLA